MSGSQIKACLSKLPSFICRPKTEVVPLQQKVAAAVFGAAVLGMTTVGFLAAPKVAHAQRISAFSFQCIGAVGEPASQLRVRILLERYTATSGQVKIDKRAYKDLSMDCTPGVNNGYSQSTVPSILDTDGRVVGMVGEIFTRASGGIVVVHPFQVNNNFIETAVMAMPERSIANAGQVKVLISIPNPSYE